VTQSLTGRLLRNRPLLVVVGLHTPGLTRLVQILGLGATADFTRKVIQLRVHPVPLVVGVGTQFHTGRGHSLLTAMTLTHRVSFR
jgi:hypothetical protein